MLRMTPWLVPLLLIPAALADSMDVTADCFEGEVCFENVDGRIYDFAPGSFVSVELRNLLDQAYTLVLHAEHHRPMQGAPVDENETQAEAWQPREWSIVLTKDVPAQSSVTLEFQVPEDASLLSYRLMDGDQEVARLDVGYFTTMAPPTTNPVSGPEIDDAPDGTDKDEGAQPTGEPRVDTPMPFVVVLLGLIVAIAYFARK